MNLLGSENLNDTDPANLSSTTFDVCVVGSGASGGTLSSRLARAGLNVIVLEGGPKIDTSRAFNTHALPYEFKNRKVPLMAPGAGNFDDDRGRGVGGKTLLWNAVAWRLSERDFKGYSFEGAGVDWPLGYADLAPYYEQIEREIGVCGNADHLEDLPDGIFLPPLPLRCSDRVIERGAASLGIKVISVRKATLTTPRDPRPACHYCGNCMRGCDVVAKYDSANVQIYPSVASGKLKLLSNAVVREVALADKSHVRGVRYIDRTTRREGFIKAHCVVVSCACMQSVGLLLMSRSSYFPNGLANSSGQLGKNYIPHFTANFDGFFRELIGTESVNDEGALDHAYIPSYMHARKRDYARSFAIQFNFQNRRYVPWATDMEGFGIPLKKQIKARYPAFLHFSVYGEMLPSSGSTLGLDPLQKDRLGLPLVQAKVQYGENEKRLFASMKSEGRRILMASNVEILREPRAPVTNHELGGCRMGLDPGTSVVNAFGQSHDIPNLFVVDGSVFPSASEKNPTLTMMALAARTADFIAREFPKGTFG
ncbi:MAG: GMC family oxidoreductase [Terriglobia bacterium]